MPSRNAFSRIQRMKEKADSLFLVYHQMGTDRSINKLAEFCDMAGIKISKNTLGRYSVIYDWQRRLLELQSKNAESRESEYNEIIDKMNRQDAIMAQGMKGLVAAGIKYHQQKMKNTQMLKMDFTSLASLAKTAQQIERLARGQATSRVDVWVDIASTVVREFVLIFQSVNRINDPEERENEFLRLGDEMVTRYYSETTKNRLEMKE